MSKLLIISIDNIMKNVSENVILKFLRALPPRPIQTISLREIHQTGLNCAGGFKHTFSVSFKGESGREESDWMIQNGKTSDQRLRFLVHVLFA